MRSVQRGSILVLTVDELAIAWKRIFGKDHVDGSECDSVTIIVKDTIAAISRHSA